jgi:hypothetical protein
VRLYDNKRPERRSNQFPFFKREKLLQFKVSCTRLSILAAPNAEKLCIAGQASAECAASTTKAPQALSSGRNIRDWKRPGEKPNPRFS